MTPDPRPPTRRECDACGTWHAQATCPLCGGARFAVEPGPVVRAVVEYTVDPHGCTRFARVASARLPWLARDAALAARLTSHCDGSPASTTDWDALGAAIDQSVREVASTTVARHAGVSPGDVAGSVRVAMRLSFHTNEHPIETPPPWEVRGFDRAMSMAAAGLDAAAVAFDTTATRLRAYAGPDVATLAVRPPVAVRAVGCAVVGPSGARLVERTLEATLLADTWTPIALPALGTALGHRLAGLSAEGVAAFSVHIELLGRAAPLRVPLAPSMFLALPHVGRRVSVALDLGATQTRLATWTTEVGPSGARASTPPELYAEVASRRLALPDGAPSDAGSLSAWLDAAMPELGRYAVDSLQGWLEHVVVAHRGVEGGLPDVRSVAVEAHALRPVAVPSLAAVFAPRWRLLHTLRQAEIAREASVAKATRQFELLHAVWRDRTRSARDPVLRWVTPEAGVEPTPPVADAAPDLVPAELRRAIDGERVAVLDVGARGAAIFTLEGTLSTSTRVRGGAGDALDAALGLPSEPATTELKARWGAAGDLHDPVVRAYAAATEAASAPVVHALARAVSPWTDQPFVLLLSGGAARNPFLRVSLERVLHEAGNQPRFVTPGALADLARAARGVVTAPVVQQVDALATVERQRMLDVGTLDVVAGLAAVDP